MKTDRRDMEILLVEDSRTFASITMCALRRGQVVHRLTWLRDGEDALDFLFRNGRFVRAPRPDLILLDLGLPKLDGRELLARIKQDDRLKQIPVVVMTVSEDEEDLLYCEHLQVERYLTKPVDLVKFLMLVEELQDCWRDDVILPTVE